jgi:hypothetical protein
MRNRSITLDIKEKSKPISNEIKITNFLLKNKGKFYTQTNIAFKALNTVVGGSTNNTIKLLAMQKKIMSKECECHGNILYGIK